MKHAETVAFGGSGLDRAAELRGDGAALARAAANPAACAVLYWRGKPLISGEKRDALVRLPLNHAILTDAAPNRILLGRDREQAIFAVDLTGWESEEIDEAQLGAFFDPSAQNHPALPPGDLSIRSLFQLDITAFETDFQ